MRRRSIAILFALLALAVSIAATEVNPDTKNFLVEAKVFIDNKPYNPTNISVSIAGNADAPSYSFNLSSQNFNKNVTIGLRLFSWYNAQWVLSRQTVSLKITDKRNVYRERSHLLGRLLKFNSRKYEAKMIDAKEQTLLNYTQVLISYDPESSLLVSRLEDPQIFNHQDNYVALADVPQDAKGKAIKINITFDVTTRSDSFINSKNHIVSLNEIATKVKQKIPLISKPLLDNLDPLVLYRSCLANYESIKRSNKQYNEKAALMENKKYDGLLLPRLHRLPFALPSPLHNAAANFNITLTDAFIPTYYFILQQGFILDAINQLQEFLRKSLSGADGRDWLVVLGEWAQVEVLISFGVALAWTILDLISYIRIQTYHGLSRSFAYFFVAWLLIQIITLSIRLGSSISIYWGLGCFIISLVLLKFITSYLQAKFNKYLHEQSSFDKGITELCFNLIMVTVLANGVMHLWVQKDFANGELFFWSLSELELLLSQYYYFLVMLPPFLLSFKLKSTSHIGWARLLLFLVIALKDDYWLLIESHWALIALKLKEQILFVLILLLKIVYGNRPIKIIEPEPELKIESQSEKKEKSESEAACSQQLQLESKDGESKKED